MKARLAGCIAAALILAAPLAQAQSVDVAPVRISQDARLTPGQRERLQSYADKGGEALRRFVWRTRMIYNWSLNDLVTPLA
ncbi:MAG: hypothetical protein ACHQJ7_03595 [Vicinamibacteria bacterium]|jgi:hypothetical protein